jgi:hypothetical protein
MMTDFVMHCMGMGGLGTERGSQSVGIVPIQTETCIPTKCGVVVQFS